MIMLKLLFAFLIFLPLIGCGRTLADEAHEQARYAFELGDFSRGSLLLAAGCNTLHSQSIYLLHIVNYQSSGDVLGAIEAWLSIGALDARYDFVENAAYELMREFAHVMILQNDSQGDRLYVLN